MVFGISAQNVVIIQECIVTSTTQFLVVYSSGLNSFNVEYTCMCMETHICLVIQKYKIIPLKFVWHAKFEFEVYNIFPLYTLCKWSSIFFWQTSFFYRNQSIRPPILHVIFTNYQHLYTWINLFLCKIIQHCCWTKDQSA